VYNLNIRRMKSLIDETNEKLCNVIELLKESEQRCQNLKIINENLLKINGVKEKVCELQEKQIKNLDLKFEKLNENYKLNIDNISKQAQLQVQLQVNVKITDYMRGMLLKDKEINKNIKEKIAQMKIDDFNDNLETIN
jgi:hypothetical protein